MKQLKYLLAGCLLLSATLVSAASLQLQLQPDPANPAHPTMGDWMHFDSVITNSGQQPIEGLVAWISLVEVTPGKEQPMDLEDWSAHKAVTGTTLQPGATLNTQWPMRLIQNGDYRVVISTTDRNNKTVFTSPTLQFHVTQKPVVESTRILPVALGIPLLIGGLFGVQKFRHQHKVS
ncbi:hypothetical protein ACFQGA_15025 [Marinobacter koreensis]|jgi:hypothetical protein|uniref:Uncharacterized protein n=1 Tax=Marinobacter koreensis TaxID=335974 RepID=A0ABW0RML6_9GAMM|nr:hypothetical protein [Marinobacter koreensis]MCK7549665.1 hypothetical protein [Marinobacter koreensis]